jgi:hypothetical protein
LKPLRHLVILVALITAGSVAQRSCIAPALALPQRVAEWSIVGKQSCAKPALAQFQIVHGTSGAQLVCRAEYAGAPEMTLTIYAMPGWPGPTAFGAFQDWQTGQRPPGTVTFYRPGYFGVVESLQADVTTLKRFATAAEATFSRDVKQP